MRGSEAANDWMSPGSGIWSEDVVAIPLSTCRFPNPSHICIVTETYPPEVNGVAMTLRHLVCGLRARGNLVSVVRPYQNCSDASGYEDMVVGGLPLPGYPELQFGLPCARRLVRLWRHHRPSAVYVATEGPLGWSSVRAARRLGIPVFSGFHTNYHSYSRHYRVAWFERLVLFYLRRFHNQTCGTFVPTDNLRDKLAALGFRNVSRVARGVDSNLFDPKKRSDELRGRWEASDRDLVLLYLGRLAGEKNVPLAIAAYREIKRIVPTARMVMVGDGPLRSSLEAANRDLVFCGTQVGEALATHYASADIFLFPSETETFGNVTLEALASGLGVVAYDYAAAHTHIRNRESGMLALLGDPRAFVESALTLASCRSLLETIRQRAREHAESVGWERVVRTFETLLLGNSDEESCGDLYNSRRDQQMVSEVRV